MKDKEEVELLKRNINRKKNDLFTLRVTRNIIIDEIK
jgi:hypothetical protein